MAYSAPTANVNPQRPYYTPGLHHQHNYTSLPSSETIPGLTPDVFDVNGKTYSSPTARFSSFATLKYVVTMLTSPFEVGTTLLQVQYSPHEDLEVLGEPGAVSTTNLPSAQDMALSSSDEDDDDAEFYTMQQRGSKNPISTDLARSRSRSAQQVYSVYDDMNRPEHQMTPMDGGVLQILGHIAKQPTEGWKSLFKGQRAAWGYELLRGLLLPTMENSLNDLFGLYDDTIPLTHLESVTPNVSTMLVSHIVIGVLLSPLEIARTRLIVQSKTASRYTGPINALRTMCREEGGLRNVYLSVNLIPTILFHTITPLLSCTSPLIVDRVLNISPSDSPLLYGVAELAISTLGLIVTLPLETIRKRLHCQIQARSPKSNKQEQGSGLPFKTAVAIRSQPYRGVLDALYRIMKEEGTKDKRNKSRPLPTPRLSPVGYNSSSDSEENGEEKHRTQKRQTSAWGIRGLYKGFGMQMAANIMVFFFHTLNGIEEEL